VRGSRAEWIVLAALLAVMVLASVLTGGRGPAEEREGFFDPSTYNAAGSGTKGLYVWLEELGVRVRRWEQPLDGFPEEATLVWVIGPRRPPDAYELESLERWVRSGGALVLADATVGGPVPDVWAGAPILKFGLRPRPARLPGPLRPAFPSVYAAGVESIEPRGRVRFHRQAPAGWAPLFADAEGDVVAIRRLGRGTLIAIADPGLFSNARLEAAGHARLALNIVRAHAGKGAVLVDEFHHGHGDHDAFSRYLRQTSAPWMLAQGALAVLAFFVARGTRFGPPAPPPGPERASSLEYVGALGDLYRRAGARRLAAEALARSFRRRLAEALGAGPGEESGRLAARAAHRLGVKEALVAARLAPGEGAGASDETLLKYAQSVHRLERRLRPHRSARSGSAGSGN